MLTSEWRNLRSAQYPSGNQTYSYPSLAGRGGSTPYVEFPDMLLSLARGLRGLRGLMGLDVIEGEVPLPFPPCLGARPSRTRSHSICSGDGCTVCCCILSLTLPQWFGFGFQHRGCRADATVQGQDTRSELEGEMGSPLDSACVQKASDSSWAVPRS